ncbi:MAG: hypothetical protein C0402_13925 [Thermodesulfovibrio sp.]|nr:hypothetical protein [Thermodesulfovibrio sp.]
MLMLFLMVSFFGAEGTLLCFGKDGHVAMEFVDACNGAWAGSQLEGMDSDACGPCLDIQFLSSPANTTNASHHVNPLPLLSSHQTSLYLRSEENPGRHIYLPQYPHHKSIASLHSVVLLI